MKNKKLFIEWENLDKIPMFEINLRDYVDTLDEDEYIYTYITGDIKGSEKNEAINMNKGPFKIRGADDFGECYMVK
jgi:hypothetical protein